MNESIFIIANQSSIMKYRRSNKVDKKTRLLPIYKSILATNTIKMSRQKIKLIIIIDNKCRQATISKVTLHF